MMRRFDLSKPIPDRIKFSKRTTGRTRAFLDTSTLPSATLPIQVSPHQTSRCGRSHATPGSPCHPIRRQSARRSRGDTAHGLQRTQRRNPRKPRTHAAGARGIRGCARHRQTIQRASIREKDRVVLADNRRRARLQTSLAHHRVRCLRHRHRPRFDREAPRCRRNDPRCAQRCSMPALQWSRSDADRRAFAVSVNLKT